jgi:peroxiredoxin Q/BCP
MAAIKEKTATSAPSSAGPRPGDKAPAFKLSDDAGKAVSLSDFKGKKACSFRDNLNRLGKSGAVVLGVSADSVESHRKFKEKQGLNFPLLSDPDHKALDAYGVWQEKSLYGRKFMGIVRTTFIIDETGKIAKIFPKVKVNGHVDEVLAGLKS